MNKEYLKIIINDEQNSSKIHPADCVDEETLSILMQGNKRTRDSCFARVSGNPAEVKYNLEFTCSKCDEVVLEKWTKNEILTQLEISPSFQCEKCRTNTSDTLTDERVFAVAMNTLSFINKYLTPTTSNIYTEYAEKQLAAFKRALRTIDEDKVAEMIKNMSYENFLQTLYWKAVSFIVKETRDNKCQVCSATTGIVAHHNTYQNHGYEHKEHVMKSDLVVLCDRCHTKFHSKVQ